MDEINNKKPELNFIKDRLSSLELIKEDCFILTQVLLMIFQRKESDRLQFRLANRKTHLDMAHKNTKRI